MCFLDNKIISKSFHWERDGRVLYPFLVFGGVFEIGGITGVVTKGRRRGPVYLSGAQGEITSVVEIRNITYVINIMAQE
jgi:hypothetical protein